MADTGKKRKRSAEDAAPKKKASQSTIAVTHRGRSGPLPVIAVTKGIQAPSVAFDAYTNDDNDSSIILQSSQHPRLDYTASSADDGLAHYAAIFDPSTETLKVIPAHQTHLRCVLRAVPQTDDSGPKTAMSQRIALGQEFGTKKAKKAIADKTVNAITAAPSGTKDAVQDAILEEVAELVGPEVVQDTATQLSAKPIPQPNLDAQKVEEVYPLDSLIPSRMMSLLTIREWQEKARAEENIQQSHRFTAWRVAALGKSNDVFRLKALRYLGLLLQFHDLLKTTRDGRRVPKKETLEEKLAEYPHSLVDFVRRKFSDEHNMLNKWRVEFLHTNICVLALYVDLWEMDISNLRNDLKLETKTIVQYFSELGCRISTMTEKERAARNLNKAQASQVKMARLKLPLDFPKPRAGRRK